MQFLLRKCSCGGRSAILTSPHRGLWVGEDNLAPYSKGMPSTDQRKLFTECGVVQSSSNW